MHAATKIPPSPPGPTRLPRASVLPERVRMLVEAKEIESERLIGWMQLVVLGIWASLFAFSPRPADAPDIMLFEPVPIALATYLGFTVGRLALAYRGKLPVSIIVASIFADVGVLLCLMWSFHEQYGQPAAFSLKIPTFVYMFVFVALRALRFDPRLVLTAGAAAALGWLGLVALVIDRSGPDALTRSFVEYVEDGRILLGAEFDKVLTILIVAGVLALAVRRARETLLTAVREQAAAREMRRFMADGVADAIAGADQTIQAGEAHERSAAILMLDIRGFTSFSKTVSPREIVAMLTSLHARLVPIVEAHGGVVDKFLGDGAMITFGAVEPSETSAADALRALDEVLRESEAWRRTIEAKHGFREILEVNAAVTAGPVVFATIGNEDRLEYTVIGEPVNLAAKLEKHNKIERSRAIIASDTVALARRQGYAPPPADAVVRRDCPSCSVAGVGGTVDFVALEAAR